MEWLRRESYTGVGGTPTHDIAIYVEIKDNCGDGFLVKVVLTDCTIDNRLEMKTTHPGASAKAKRYAEEALVPMLLEFYRRVMEEVA